MLTQMEIWASKEMHPHSVGKKQTGACSLRQPRVQELEGKKVFNTTEAYTQTWLKLQDMDRVIL